jgi:hypothetical protein
MTAAGVAAGTAGMAMVSPAPSPFPASFQGNPFLYGATLASLLTIGVLGVLIVRWMARDLWRDRHVDHPRSIAFLFRLMILIAGTVATLRTLPEVIFMTCYGDPGVSADLLSLILTVKRVLDIVSLPFVTAWMTILVMIYPFTMLTLRAMPARSVEIDLSSAWFRLVKPSLIFVTVIAISTLMATAKTGG